MVPVAIDALGQIPVASLQVGGVGSVDLMCSTEVRGRTQCTYSAAWEYHLKCNLWHVSGFAWGLNTGNCQGSISEKCQLHIVARSEAASA